MSNFRKINPTQNKVKSTREVKNKNLKLNTNLRYNTNDYDYDYEEEEDEDEDDNNIKSCNTFGNIIFPSRNKNNSLLFNTENTDKNRTLLNSQSYQHLFNPNIGTPKRNYNLNNQNRYTIT